MSDKPYNPPLHPDPFGNDGISFRDFIAAKCLAAQITMDGMEGCDKEHLVAMAYEMADAMLVERSK